MSKLKDAISALETNDRFKTCHRWRLVCDDKLLDAQFAARNVEELIRWVDTYYETGTPSLNIFITNLFEKIPNHPYRHQKVIDDLFAHMHKLQAEFVERERLAEATLEAAQSDAPCDDS